MGTGIAQVAAAAGHRVKVFDADVDVADAAVAAIRSRFARAAAKGRMSDDEAGSAGARVSVAAYLEDLAGSGLVIEAVAEDLGVKRQLFAELERICGPDAILASNTSSLSISDIARELDHPGRVAGLHFFNPAPVLPLVEVVSGTSTDPAVADDLVATAEAWGKTAVRATSTPGFIVNRVARPFYAEAFRLLDASVTDPATLDALMRESGGFRMGPCELTDLIGQDVNAAVTRSVWEAFGHDPRFEPSDLQQALVAAGRLGRKSGSGWYDDGVERPAPATAERIATPVNAVEQFGSGGPLERLRAATAGSRPPASPTSGWEIVLDGVVLRLTDGRTAAQQTGGGPVTVVLVDLALDYGSATRVAVAAPPSAPASHVDAAVGYLQGLGFAVTVLPDSPGLVVARTVAMLAAFALDAVDAGVATPEDVDTAMRLGVNYPRGPYEWGAALGWDWVAGILDSLAAAEDAQRYRVSPHLRSLAVEPAPGASDATAEGPSADGGVDTVAEGIDAALVLATRAADAMWVSDAASQALGMIRLDVAPGYARFAMTVGPDMVNGHRICHGGYIFTLADTAFAFACNSYNRNTVAQSCDIAFLKAVYEGDTLVAEATERYREGRNGLYDVTIYRRPGAPVEPAGPHDPVAPTPGEGGSAAVGEVVAEFRGRSREIPGTLVVESGD